MARHASRRLALAAACATLVAVPACKRQHANGGELSQGQADRYVDRAVKKSSEGVVFFPSEAAQREYEMPRLNEVAQALRTPFALCFVERAIEKVQWTEVDGEMTYDGVPEGQAKIRARISQGGDVVSTEVLETGFSDEWMVECLEKVIAEKRFPPSKSGFNKHIDVVYWVSLGFFAEARTAKFQDFMRREQTRAAVRAKDCMQGRVKPGHYELEGLNLFDRKGNTVANRVDPGGMDESAVKCLASAFKAIRIHEEAESFIRPVSPRAVIDVASDGSIAVADEEWLRLLELEEAAKREEKRRELLGADQEAMGGPVVPTEPRAVEGAGRQDAPEPEPEPEPEPIDTHKSDGALRLDPR